MDTTPVRGHTRLLFPQVKDAMSLSLVDDFEIPFEIVEPAAQTTPLLFNSPHSGRLYPRSFVAASRLDP